VISVNVHNEKAPTL